MKKFFIAVSSLFAALFIFAAVMLKFFPEKIYVFLYPDEPFIYSSQSIEKKVTLKQGDYVTYGKYDGQPLLWKYVLDEKEPILQNVYIIDFMPYSEISSDWETSGLHDFLNNGDVFELGDKNGIKNGEIFVLSSGQISKLEKDDRKKTPTPQAIQKSGSENLMLRKYCWYWTKSKISTTSLCTAAVTQRGTVYKTYITDPVTGVCPAFQLENKSIIINAGKGTRKEPYVMKGADYEK